MLLSQHHQTEEQLRFRKMTSLAVRLCCLSRLHVAGSAVYACFPVDACSVDCLSLKITDSLKFPQELVLVSLV